MSHAWCCLLSCPLTKVWICPFGSTLLMSISRPHTYPAWMVVATTSRLVLSLFSFVNLKHTIMFTSALFLFPEDPHPTLLHHFEVPNGLTPSVFSSLLLPFPGTLLKPDFQMRWSCLLFGALSPHPHLPCSPGEFILSFLASSVTLTGK